MKKFKIPLTAVALFLGVAGAFATKASTMGTGLYWFQTDPATQEPVTYISQSPTDPLNCQGDEESCSKSYNQEDVQLKSGSTTTYEVIPGHEGNFVDHDFRAAN